jgi:hypothetical protein
VTLEACPTCPSTTVTTDACTSTASADAMGRPHLASTHAVVIVGIKVGVVDVDGVRHCDMA